MLAFVLVAVTQAQAAVDVDAFGSFPGFDTQQHVGSETCAACHADLAAQRETHHMARTARLPAATEPLFSDRRVADGARRAPPAAADVSAVFGSGIHGVTPVLTAPGRRIREHALSYSEARSWFTTPGAERESDPLGSLKSIEESAECLGCHMTTAVWLDDRLDFERSALGVQCERCHGPGGAHLDAVSAGNDDELAIFNPGALAPGARASFCAQCHRQPIDFEPLDVLGRVPVIARHAGAGLMMSECFRRSPRASTITCTDCHSPHRNIEDVDRARFQATCLRCHEDPAGRHRYETVTIASDCVRCHMPIESEGFHGVSFTDHWIRTPGVAPPLGTDREKDALDYLELLYRNGWEDASAGDERRTRLALGMAEVLYGLDRKHSAFGWLDEALSRAPTTHQRLKSAAMFRQGGRLDDADDVLETALETDPQLLRAHYDRGQIAAERTRFRDAIAHFERALAIRSDFAPAHAALAASLRQEGRLDEALQHYRSADELEPDNPFVLEGLGWILATHPSATVRSPGAAVSLAERAAAATGYRHPGVLDTLAAAYAASGDFETARNAVARAITIAMAANASELLAGLKTRRALYESDTAFVDASRRR